MINFQYRQREYVPRYDLQTLSKSFDTLEQGHKDAVKAASELKVAVANMDMHDSEDGYKAQLINDITKTIDDNTMFGNSAGAVDDLILKTGDVMSNPGTLGRIKANAAYKENLNAINSNQELTEREKEYFRQLNPYHYNDKFDENGKIIGGTAWTPNVRATKKIPANLIFDQALKWAAKEAGGGSNTRWLKADGTVTNNASESAYGEYYNQSTNKFERLTHNKLQAGIQSALRSIPGAMESLRQEYDIESWYHNKGEFNNVVDSNGIKLDFDQYINRMSTDFKNAASYYNSWSTTEYGGALKAHKTAIANTAGVAGNNPNGNMIGIDRSTTFDPVKFTDNTIAQSYTTAHNAMNRIQEIYKSVTGKSLVLRGAEGGWVGTINNAGGLGLISMGAIKNLKSKGLSEAQVKEISRLATAYNDAQAIIAPYLGDMNEKDKGIYNSIMSAKELGIYIPSSRGGTKTNDKIINSINSLKEGDSIDITFHEKNNLIDILTKRGYDAKVIQDLGFRIQGNKITIPKSKLNFLPGFAEAINDLNFNADLKDADGKSVKNQTVITTTPSVMGGRSDVQNSTKNAIKTLAINFKKLNDEHKAILTKQGLDGSNRIVDVESVPYFDLEFAANYDDYRTGRISKEQYKINESVLKEQRIDQVVGGGLTQYPVYSVDGGVGVRELVVDSSDRAKIQESLRRAYNKNKGNIIYNTVTASRLKDRNGNNTASTNIQWIDPDDNKQYNILIPGYVSGRGNDAFGNDRKQTVINTLSIVKDKYNGSAILNNAGDFPSLGNVIIKNNGNGGYILKTKSTEIPIETSDAINIGMSLKNIRDVRNELLAGGQVSEEAAKQICMDAAININPYINGTTKDIYTLILQDLIHD